MHRSNSKVRKWLESNGYKDIHFFPHTKYFKDIEFQGLKFDGIASTNTTLVLFQVKSNTKPTKKFAKQYDLVSLKYGIKCMWFNCPDRKEVEVYV